MMLVDAAVQTSLYSPVSPLSLLCLSSVSPLSLLYLSPLFQVQAKLENVKRYGQGGGVTRMSIDDYKPSYNGINLSTARTTTARTATPQPSLHSSQPSQPLLTTPRKKPETLSTAPLNQQNNTVVATALLERSIPAGANLIPMDNAEMQGMLLLLLVMMMLMMLLMLLMLLILLTLLILVAMVATGCPSSSPSTTPWHRSTCTHPAPFTLSPFRLQNRSDHHHRGRRQARGKNHHRLWQFDFGPTSHPQPRPGKQDRSQTRKPLERQQFGVGGAKRRSARSATTTTLPCDHR